MRFLIQLIEAFEQLVYYSEHFFINFFFGHCLISIPNSLPLVWNIYLPWFSRSGFYVIVSALCTLVPLSIFLPFILLQYHNMRSLVRVNVRASNHSLSSDTRTNDDDSSTVQARHSTRLNNKIQKFVFECKSHYVQLYTKHAF